MRHSPSNAKNESWSYSITDSCFQTQFPNTPACETMALLILAGVMLVLLLFGEFDFLSGQQKYPQLKEKEKTSKRRGGKLIIKGVTYSQE